MKKLTAVFFCFMATGFLVAGESSAQVPGQFVSSQLGAFIALIAITISIALAVPVFITKITVRDLVKKELEKEKKNNSRKFDADLFRTDAHLSRMIGFLLMDKQYYAWAIGWGFRALKRYKGISGDYQKIYREFHEMTLHNIIRRSIDNLQNDCSSEIAYGADEDVVFRTKIRAIKDFVDFEYEIYILDKEQIYSQEICKYFADDLKAIHRGMIDLWSELTDGKRDTIVEKILLQSSHKDKSNELDSFIQKEYIQETSK